MMTQHEENSLATAKNKCETLAVIFVHVLVITLRYRACPICTGNVTSRMAIETATAGMQSGDDS